jgi:hypothetical protein
MVQELGKQLLPNDNQGYQKVIDQQNRILIDFYIDSLRTSIHIKKLTEYDSDISESEFNKYAELFYNDYLKNTLWNNYLHQDYSQYAEIRDSLTAKLVQEFKTLNDGIQGIDIRYDALGKFKSVIEPAIKNDKKLEELFISKLTHAMYLEINGMPF